jgi:protein phosphatase
MTTSLCYAVRSERGFVRENNEDAAFAGPRLLALADGMGGHAAGEIASALVIAELAPLDEGEPGADLVAELRDATVRGNAAIARYVAENPELDGMGTTLTAILFAGDTCALVHVGDSRAYLLRDGSLSQITRDDTLVQSLVDDGALTAEEAWAHPHRSMVLRAMTGKELDPSPSLREVRPGNRYLVCSDGLSDVVPSGALEEALGRFSNPQDCVQQLVRLALRAGTHDNVTCIVADVVEGESGYDIPLVTGAAGHGGVPVRP